MKTTLALALALGLPVCWAAGESAAKLETTEQRAAYSVGHNLGTTLSEDAPDLDITLVQRGLVDAFNKIPSALTPAQLTDAMVLLEQSMKKQKAIRKTEAVSRNKEASAKFLADNATKPGVITLPSGLQYQVLASGKSGGASPRVTDLVKVHYQGQFINGHVFDSSIANGEPASFKLDQLTQGWIEGLQKMKVGDKWKLFIPAKLAYGDAGINNVILPGTALIFEIELLGVTREDTPTPTSAY